MIMTTTPLRKVAFLDTNVLHFMDLYLRHAKGHDLYPFAGDVAAAERHLKETIEYASLNRSLNKGLKTVRYLQREHPRVEYSTASELELIAGRAHGKAIERAAAEGIPDRMWTRHFEPDINDRLRATDLTEIRTAVEGLGPLMEEVGIDAAVGSADRLRDALGLAGEIMGLVYMQPIDSVIYAGALVAEADHLISDDSYLKQTVNRLKTERTARKRLETITAAVLSREPGSVILPNACGIPKGGS